MSHFSHLALLGRQPELGLVELESLLGAPCVAPFGRQLALVGSSLELARLGGALKFGRIIYDGPSTDLQSLPLKLEDLPVRESKLPFAVSVYGTKVSTQAVLAAGLSLKKLLRERGSVRLITPSKGTEVSVAQLKHNRVIEDGFELVVALDGDRMVMALTEQIQDIDWYSRRDYDRPARSAKVGMLPPKLAQILVNTTAPAKVVDPFCGTGVVLQEALLMGRAAEGSDLAPEMIEASKTNLTWLAGQTSIPLPKWEVAAADARVLTLPTGQISIVSEGYLGPNLMKRPDESELAKLKADLGELYQACLAHWAPQLASGTELALCLPAWRTARGWSSPDLVDELGRLGYTTKVFTHAQAPLLYARDDQIVGRALLLLRKN